LENVKPANQITHPTQTLVLVKRKVKMDAVTELAALRTQLFADTPMEELLLEWLPLALAAVLPMVCLPFVAIGCCGKGSEDEDGAKLRFGERTALRKMLIAVRADIRMGIASKAAKQYVSKKDVEAGRSNGRSGKRQQTAAQAADRKQGRRGK
jgi:hypothetical protein